MDLKTHVHVLRQEHRNWTSQEVKLDIANGIEFKEIYDCKKREDIYKNRAIAYRDGLQSGAIYLGYLDDDDVVVPGYFSELEAFLDNNPDVAGVAKKQLVVYNDGNVAQDYTELSGNIVHRHPQGFHGPYLYRASVLKNHLEFIENSKHTEHLGLAFRIHNSGEDLVYIDELGSFWCQRRPMPDVVKRIRENNK